MYASLHSNCAVVRNFLKNLGVVLEVKENSLPFVSSLVTHEELRDVTCKNVFNHLVQAKCENRNPKSFFQNDYHTHQSFSLRGTHELYLNAVQTQHRGRPGI